MSKNSSLIIDFSDIHKLDLDLGKKVHLLSELKFIDIPIPDGFVITNLFFYELLQKTDIASEIENIKKSTHPALYESLPKLFDPIQKKIMSTHFPEDLTTELHNFYRKLAGVFKESALDIYSSAKENKSIAIYNIKGDANLVMKIKTLLVHYLDQPFSVIVQKAVKSKDKELIVTNDIAITDQNLLKLAKKIQNYFYFPQEIEYAIEKNRIYVTQVKPFTGIVDSSPKQTVQIKKTQKVLVKGISINRGIITGSVKVFNKYQNAVPVKSSEIIVLSNLNKSLYKNIKKARGIVVDAALPNSHALMLYRKNVKIPTIASAKNATKILRNGNIITVNGISGEIYQGGFA